MKRLKGVKPSKKEVLSFLVSILALGFIFSYRMWYSFTQPGGVRKSMRNLLNSTVIVGISLLIHQIVHRLLARSYECKVEYKLLPKFLLLSLGVTFITNGKIPLAIPGCIAISTLHFTRLGFHWTSVGRRDEGEIALFGIVANLVLAFLFKVLSPLLSENIVSLGLSINAWFALSNSLPIPPLDGSKVLMFSRILYFCLIASSVLILVTLPLSSPLLTLLIIPLFLIFLFIWANWKGF